MGGIGIKWRLLKKKKKENKGDGDGDGAGMVGLDSVWSGLFQQPFFFFFLFYNLMV